MINMNEKKELAFLIEAYGCGDVEKNGVTLSYLGNVGYIQWINDEWVDYAYIEGYKGRVWVFTARDKEERDKIVSALELVGKRVVKIGYKRIYFVDYQEGETEEEWLARQHKRLDAMSKK